MIEVILTNGEPNSTKRNCYDCTYCKAAISWWCTNKKAINHRGTSFPGTQNCEFWKGCRTKKQLSWFERWFGDFMYIEAQ